MKQKNLTARYRRPFCIAAILAVSLLLSGCGLSDFFLYLYGGDSFVDKQTEPSYLSFSGTNGVTVVYDSNVWLQVGMAQEDTVSALAGGSNDSTVVLLQVTDEYTDFLAQSGQELESETGTVQYDFDFSVPDAQVTAVRYDCGSYQTIFAVLEYEKGGTIYVTAATKLGDESLITDFLQTVYPTGETPESAQALLAPEQASPGQKSFA